MIWTCPNCSQKVPMEPHEFPIRCGCGLSAQRADDPAPKFPAKKPPSMGKKVANYATAITRWKAAGSPTRSDVEVQAIYDFVCSPCEHFTGKGCKLCGCRLSRDAGAMNNKIRMATESCPVSKWRSISWAYCVTTSPRIIDTLPRTLASLAAAGFPEPWIFADGDAEVPDGYSVTRRQPQIGAWPSWFLAAQELFQRNPQADAFAFFQDDIVASRNVRQFLEIAAWPSDGYISLFASQANGEGVGFYRARKRGLGAQALVFTRDQLIALLSSRSATEHRLGERGHKNIDGAVVDAMRKIGIQEYIHGPSLVQHLNPLYDKAMPRNGSTLKHPFRAQSNAPSFRGESYDALKVLGSRNARVTSRKARPRIALVGWNTAQGIGYCNRDICTHLPIDTWLVPKHPKFAALEPHPNVKTVECDTCDVEALKRVLADVDVLLSVEKEFFPYQSELAHDAGVDAVCIPMLEWLPQTGWPLHVDRLLCPTRDCYRRVSKEYPLAAREFYWPVDMERFRYTPRSTCNRFVFINGNGGWQNRKGANAMAAAARLAPMIPLIVYDQTATHRSGKSHAVKWPDHVEMRGMAESRESLYTDGEVLIMPARNNGIGLEQLEAMACGMPVIATAGPPMNEHVWLDLIHADRKIENMQRPVACYDCDPEHLAQLMQKWQGQDISEHSATARQYAEGRSWQASEKQFFEAIQ